MADPFASPADVAARWRDLDTAEERVAITLCEDASAMIRSEIPGIDDRIAAGTINGDLARAVCANMVKRALIAPEEGVTQASDTVGDVTQARSYANPLGNIFMTAAERTLILGRQPKAMSMAYGNTTIQPC